MGTNVEARPHNILQGKSTMPRCMHSMLLRVLTSIYVQRTHMDTYPCFKCLEGTQGITNHSYPEEGAGNGKLLAYLVYFYTPCINVFGNAYAGHCATPVR